MTPMKSTGMPPRTLADTERQCQEPPRSTRRVQSPVWRALPSAGAPVWSAFQQSCTYSLALPIRSCKPQALGAYIPTTLEKPAPSSQLVWPPMKPR